MTEIYGQLSSEKAADENALCREIAKEISVYGITDRQRIMLIYLLALEIENAGNMQELTGIIKEIFGDQLFISTLQTKES